MALLTLPGDCLHEIFRHLDIASLALVSGTCHSLREHALDSSLWRPYIDAFAELQRSYSSIDITTTTTTTTTASSTITTSGADGVPVGITTHAALCAYLNDGHYAEELILGRVLPQDITRGVAIMERLIARNDHSAASQHAKALLGIFLCSGCYVRYDHHRGMRLLATSNSPIARQFTRSEQSLQCHYTVTVLADGRVVTQRGVAQQAQRGAAAGYAEAMYQLWRTRRHLVDLHTAKTDYIRSVGVTDTKQPLTRSEDTQREPPQDMPSTDGGRDGDDDNDEHYWLKRAAQLGSGRACAALGDLLGEEGEGAKWVEKARALNCADRWF
eukprot:TRINITY_DN14747_c0_g1_i1.p1 TRINITY_DN14747_c0_g1~~TRINITY_DN14747_c0_g1_i1.p1  ORF type:complete len:343 (+),score=55.82 TRINITY_DN14747_c0_g1_i1:48-1031(+)